MGLDSQQNSTDTKKDEKLGYCLFKEGHVSNVQAKPNIPNSVSGKSFILKATVHASMKKLSYIVYVHLEMVMLFMAVHVRREREANVNMLLLCCIKLLTMYNSNSH